MSLKSRLLKIERQLNKDDGGVIIYEPDFDNPGHVITYINGKKLSYTEEEFEKIKQKSLAAGEKWVIIHDDIPRSDSEEN